MNWEHSFIALLAALTCSCWCGPRAPVYAPVTLESGVIVHDITIPIEGPGVELGDLVTLNYEIHLEDGTIVDSSFERGMPIEFAVGASGMPKGLEEGLMGMRRFGERHLIVPSAMGYGPDGLEDLVPPDSMLRFILELVGLKPKTATTP
jgi:peptidylprolyl isomerase